MFLLPRAAKFCNGEGREGAEVLASGESKDSKIIPRTRADSPPLRVGFLLSGSGRTLENLHASLLGNPCIAQIVAVISDREEAYGLTRAAGFGIPHQVLPCRTKEDSASIFAYLESVRAEVALLGGFLRLLTIPAAWKRRVLNIHPALIPKFCGRGFYGERVHRAVLDAGERESGCTVHFVDNQYDHGPVLLQERVPVVAGDSVASLAARVFEAECRAYPRALRLFAEGRICWENERPVILEPLEPPR